MSNFFLDLKVISSIRNSYLEDTKGLMQYSGENIGNFAFRHALNLMIEITSYKSVAYDEINRAINSSQQPSSVVISCANWLCASDNYEKANGVRATILENLKCPITVFGLGAQATSGDSNLKLGPNTVRLAKVISDKSISISVRDNFTRSILNDIGIDNVVVTGCPSNFINPSPFLGKEVIERAIRTIETKKIAWGDIRTHFSEFSGGHKMSGAVLKKTLGLLARSPSFYALQTPVLLPFLLNETTGMPNVYSSNQPESVSNLENMLRAKLLHFSSIEGWLDFSRTCHLSLGMRIHGNMIPLQAGVPSMVIGHDSRTMGLSSSMGIPVVTPEKFIEYSDNSPVEFFEDIIVKMEDYDKKRSDLAKNFINYIEENNLEATEHLKGLCRND